MRPDPPRCIHCRNPRAYWTAWVIFIAYCVLAWFLGPQLALVILVTAAALPLSFRRVA